MRPKPKTRVLEAGVVGVMIFLAIELLALFIIEHSDWKKNSIQYEVADPDPDDY